LLELLWPESESALAQNNLHKTLHAARRALEPSLSDGPASVYLVFQEHRLALQAPGGLRVDWLDWQAEVRSALADGGFAAIAQAISHAGSGLLEEDIYEDWAAGHRERYRALLEELLLRASALAPDPAAAVEFAQRAVEQDRTNEAGHRRLMSLYAEAGQRHLAIQQFRTCEEWIRKELGAAVEPATRLLFDAIAAGESPARPGAGSVASPGARSSAALPRREAAAKLAPQQTAVPVPARRSVLKRRAAVGLLVVPAVLGGAWGVFRRLGTPRIRSIAVLPLHSETELDYLAAGITETVIATLATISDLRVMARGTVAAYGHRPVDPRSVGKDLGVDAVVTGRLSESSGKVTLSAELADASDGAQLWTMIVETSETDIRTAQTRLSSELASALSRRLSTEQRGRMLSQSKVRPDAYREYLLGRHHWNKRTPESFLRAQSHLERAIELEPSFALAHTALADSYALMAFIDQPPGPLFRKALESAATAMRLDANSAETQTTRAMLAILGEWDFKAGEAGFRRAIAINPGLATPHHWLAVHLCSQQRFSEARAEFERALAVDPLSAIIQTNAAYPDAFTGQNGAAIRQYRKVIEMDPSFSTVRDDLTQILERVGRWAEATVELAAHQRLEGYAATAQQIEALPRSAPRDRHLQALQLVLARAARAPYFSPVNRAQILVRIGQLDDALAWLEKALEEHSPPMVYLMADPVYQPLRKLPRFARLLQAVGLDPSGADFVSK
jgi:TolB-like protein/DNA-binding SARP family transcriptional activator